MEMNYARDEDDSGLDQDTRRQERAQGPGKSAPTQEEVVPLREATRNCVCCLRSWLEIGGTPAEKKHCPFCGHANP